MADRRAGAVLQPDGGSTTRHWWRRTLGVDAIAPEIKTSRVSFFRSVALIRGTAGVVNGIAMLAIGDFSPSWLVPAFAVVMFIALPESLVMYRRHGVIPPIHPLLDVIGLSVAAAFEPNLLIPYSVSVIALVAYSALTFRRSAGLLYASAASIGLVTAAAIGRPPGWGAYVAIVPVGLFCLAWPAGQLAQSATRALSASDHIVGELGLVLWETRSGERTPWYMHGNTQQLFGNPPDYYLVPGRWAASLHPDDLHVDEAIADALAAGRDYRVRYRMLHPDGAYRWVDEVGVTRRHPSGQIMATRGMAMEVTAQQRASETSTLLGNLVNTLPTGVAVFHLPDPLDPTSLVIVSANAAMDRFLPAIMSTSVGVRAIDVLPQAFDRERHTGVGYLAAEAASTGVATAINDGRLTGADLVTRRVSLRMNPLPNGYVSVTAEDVSDLLSAQQELIRRAYHDDLTGLPNRVRLREILAEAAIGSHLVVLDLDQFKEINDAFGHGCGDELLVEIAARLADVPDGASVARLGGDEFAVVATARTGTADEIGARLGAVFTTPITLPNGLTLQTSASLGVTTKFDDEVSVDEMLRRADVAMYRAKKTRSVFEQYRPGDESALPFRMRLLGEIRRAIHDRELELHYQPIVDCETGETRRLEGLMRWRHPQLGLLQPSEFIELTELNNLNREVVMFTVGAAIADLRRWTDSGFDVGVSINIAGTALFDPVLIDEIILAVAASGLATHAFGIELTERQLLLESATSGESMRKLAAAGVWLSIDDFGTGTSSLSSLRQIPANELKIDRAFVEDLRAGQSTLIGSIVAMSHDLGLVVVAEGVEDELTWKWLQEHGADQVQGYLFARPARAAEVTAYLAAPGHVRRTS